MTTGFSPIERMKTLLEHDKLDSDTALFNRLMYFGEMVVKLTAAGLIAAVDEGHNRHRYRLAYTLVRADGLGDWDTALADVCVGPSSQQLMPEAYEEQKQLNQKCSRD